MKPWLYFFAFPFIVIGADQLGDLLEAQFLSLEEEIKVDRQNGLNLTTVHHEEVTHMLFKK